ncbi:hypothetical protein LZ30DRAFT_585930, partial [Colletotrichum cereale]
MLLQRYESALTRVTDADADHQLQISRLTSATPSDLEQIMAWNRQLAGDDEAVEDCIHHVIARQAVAQPDVSAVCAWDGDFSYAELDRLATSLVPRLHRTGFKPGDESKAAFCLNKSKFTVVVLLAVLKAGGVCVPLNPSWPAQQYEAILGDVKPKLILSSPQYLDKLQSPGQSQSCQVWTVDEALFNQATTAADESLSAAPLSMVDKSKPGHVAYIIYTSGSTGVPKGVMLEHRSLCTTADQWGPIFGIHPGSRILQFAAYTFDGSVFEMFTTLQRGGTLCIPSDEERVNNVAAVVRRMQVTTAFLTNTVASLIQPSEVPSLRTLTLVGELASLSTVESWSKSNNFRLMNSYGPSECSVSVTGNQRLEPHATANVGFGLIGSLWIVSPDDHHHLLPIGAQGELLVESPLLARGYFNDSRRTDEVFIRSPEWAETLGYFPAQHATRFYKTGDVVKYNDDGSLTYIGRKDNQVKIHGQRVELGDIETRIR